METWPPCRPQSWLPGLGAPDSDRRGVQKTFAIKGEEEAGKLCCILWSLPRAKMHGYTSSF